MVAFAIRWTGSLSRHERFAAKAMPAFRTRFEVVQSGGGKAGVKELVSFVEEIGRSTGRMTALFAEATEDSEERELFLEAGFVEERESTLVFLPERLSEQKGFLSSNEDEKEENRTTEDEPHPALDALCDHISVRTTSIQASISFYSLLGFQPEMKFLAGGRRAAWLRSAHASMIELIEIGEDEAAPPPELWYTSPPFPRGFSHLNLDVTRHCTSLEAYLARIQANSARLFGRRVQVLEPPKDRMLFKLVVQMAFIGAPDGMVVELLRKQHVLDNDMLPDWE